MLVLALFFALIFLAIILFFVLPAMLDIKKEAQNLFSRKNEIASSLNYEKELEKFKQNYSSYTENFNKIDRLFIDYQNPVAFIEFLEKSASDFKVSLQISPISISAESGKSFTDLQVFCKGSFQGILDFLKRMELGDYLIKVQNLTITKSGAIFTIRTFASSGNL